MLAMQFGIMCVVLAGVVAGSLAQSEARFKENETGRARTVAEWLASNGGVRLAAAGEAGYLGQAQYLAESGRTLEGSTTVMIARADRRVIVSTDPLPKVGKVYLQDTGAFDGHSWTGTEEGTGAAFAMAPILSEKTRATVGVVAVARH